MRPILRFLVPAPGGDDALEFTPADVRALASRLHGAAAARPADIDRRFPAGVVTRVHDDLLFASHLLEILAAALEAEGAAEACSRN